MQAQALRPVEAKAPTAEVQVPRQRPAARPARARRRHWGLLLSLLLMVVAPVAAAGWYLFTRAEDQFASSLGFSVRKEDRGSAVEILGGIADLGGGSAGNDTDILFEYIQSPNMVRAVMREVDLVAAYTRPGDPVFSLGPDTRIEALAAYWTRMVQVYFDRSSHLIEIRVKAFTPEESLAIARAVRKEADRTINALSAVARDDATRYARDELDRALARLKAARAALTAFRTSHQIVDPEADIQGRMGLLNTLQAELADALIELDLLRQNSRPDDPRVVQAERRVEVIRQRISEERARFSAEGSASAEQEAYSELIGQYEALAVDQKFAEESYVATLAAYDAAVAEAQRQSRYLATYIEPAAPETPLYPRRWVILLTLFGGLATAWTVLTMIYYSLRDRR
ncbi:sugar transporter [Vannielia litorea]|uniref:Capsular polysaccharide transport system permease protein n=1 Tax=Vannielia litorea TaxID=1217970 RepID=A0A1N6HN57_9RHOB|nr:sugar transporter [Vannielia litorea]SIO21119.1 capsular polysaccharide transport system permease protein [Vannielia litorea]